MNNKNRLMLLVWAVLTALFAGPALHAQVGEDFSLTTRCDVGLLYQISYQPNWGDSHAVVVEVIPGGAAARAGIRVGDILLKIDGKDTYDLSEDAITGALLNPLKSSVTLEIARLGKPTQTVTLNKKCRPVEELDEGLMASAFSMYSLEDVSDRRFAMPFIHTLPTTRDFLSYSTFIIPQEQRRSPMARAIAKELERKGLTEVQTGGDLMVNIQGGVKPNSSYREGSDANLDPAFRNYRYDYSTERFEAFPFLSISAPAFSGKKRLVLDIELYDLKDNTKVWSVTARELLNQDYTPEQYVAAFAPLLMANFPFMRYIMNPSFVRHQNSYRYTGISYDADDLQIIRAVAPNSPAAKAGLHEGDRIKSINGLPLDSSVGKMTASYKDFIKASWDFRDENTRFPNDKGLQQCQYWRVDKYLQVAELLQQPKYQAAFSYLFSHRTYVHSPVIKELVFEIERNGEPLSALVTPELVTLNYTELR